MIIVPLGVASATPTATRHLSSVALWREGDVHLFDCGENAQMRMLQAGLKRSKIENIFITHFDVDHYSGLIGLISTLQLQRREKELTLVGPKGIKEYVEWNFNFANIDLNFDLNFVEISEDIESERVVDKDDYFVEARPLNHTKFCVGYRFQEKDKPGKVDADKAEALGITEDEQYKALKAGEDVELEDGKVIKSYDIVGHPRPGDSFAYITDTKYCPNSVKLAMNTNILYHEATFSDNLADKAAETGHSTSSDAARVANEAQTKLLVIGHFSARYTNPFILLREAREKFFPAWLATELRPIYTDPAQEKGIVKQKVYIKEIDESKKSSGRGQSRGGGDRKKRHSSSRDDSKRFRKRRSSSGRGGPDRGSSRRSNSDNQPRRKRRPDRSSRDQNDYDKGTSRPTKHITPRTPFDDFDRF
ncbi:MAG: ribonuclease Z [Balneolaceae bacterium]|nr:ribonuclease Z [Balneolaceae bacterium]MCH8547810.1 ribonuclease Z [Balneolaceae bacterium]